MFVSFERVTTEIQVSTTELTAWIERNWVLPVVEEGRYLFDEADVARARLIAELHRDLEVNEEAMPVVLRLLDQVYSLRRALADLNRAVKTLPEGTQEQLRSQLKKAGGTDEPPR